MHITLYIAAIRHCLFTQKGLRTKAAFFWKLLKDNQKSPRNFISNYAICEPRKISGEILRILEDHLRMYIK